MNTGALRRQRLAQLRQQARIPLSASNGERIARTIRALNPWAGSGSERQRPRWLCVCRGRKPARTPALRFRLRCRWFSSPSSAFRSPPSAWVKFVFPDAQHPPARRAQRAVHLPVPRFVRSQLFPPERGVVPWLRRVNRAGVPKTAIHEHGEAQFGENEIGTDGENAECGTRSAE